ncbi:tryptophan synthase beta subunit-like PLP-dependent enzyme [Lipomyces arxii]|uniref:tryptophan synthase beta subunit-like PLP-dependent enzyme n=1 Tax=Lipomyces arxii TaxID=56418 RepID=UPI0034CDA094
MNVVNDELQQAPYIKTPLIRSSQLSQIVGCEVLLKIESLQPSASFKSRGLGRLVQETLLNLPSGTTPKFFSSSGGNAGCAAAQAAQLYGCKCTVVVPSTAPAHMITRLRERYAAEVIVHGTVWKEADDKVRELIAAYDGPAQYCHPFDNSLIWEGNSTIVDEIMDQLHELGYSRTQLQAISASVGGGGLYNGIVQGLQRNFPGGSRPTVVTCETTGTQKLFMSMKQGKRVVLDKITSIASSLGADAVSPQTFEYANKYPTLPVVVSDTQAVEACLKLLDTHRILVEPACGAALAPWYSSLVKLDLASDSVVVIIVCGGSTVTLESMLKYKSQYTD